MIRNLCLLRAHPSSVAVSIGNDGQIVLTYVSMYDDCAFFCPPPSRSVAHVMSWKVMTLIHILDHELPKKSKMKLNALW